MKIRKATINDCYAIAELALIAGEGIPAFFWEQSRKQGQKALDVGAQNAASENENFSYRNVHLVIVADKIAGMLLAYRLPPSENSEPVIEFPEFIRPLIELEQCVPDSFYINMLATYPKYRGKGIGKELMDQVNSLAIEAGCTTISIEVFEQNTGALRLYQRLGYRVVDQRNVIPHECHPYDGKMVLLTKSVCP
ncbi:MAG: GNAT family N-acetyltransferase [Gammaproteobacteria bacterium]|nr:GNAT family N-acetyltransferase [Gammaproteobacteria bacterium]